MPVATSRPRIGSIKDYYGFLATSCGSIDVWHTTYFHTLDNASKIVEWMKGCGLGTEGAGGTATGAFFAMTAAGVDCVAA
jgi:trans-aconitate methyltransferase